MNKELKLSYDILNEIYFKGAYLNISLNDVLFKADKLVNKKTVTKVVYGVIENNLKLNYNLIKFVNAKTKPKIKLILKMGMFVKNFLNVFPDYTIVNELTNIAKKVVSNNIAGFVNATLKNIINSKLVYPADENSAEFLSVKYNYPVWLVKKLIKDYGADEFLKMLKTKLSSCELIHASNKIINLEELLKKHEINFVKSYFNTFYVDYEKLLSIKELENNFIVQGMGSVIACNVLNPKQYSSILDVCASPGGKSVYLATNFLNTNVTACDINPTRLKLVDARIKKFSIKNIKTKVQDATRLNEFYVNKFDYVLCDVPCSGTGVICKKPDILLNRTESNINELANIQWSILNTCCNYVKNNGILLYSTCSILKQENIEIVEKFLKTHKNFSIEKIEKLDIPAYDENNTITLLPHISNTEGFFIAKFKRNN